MTLYTLQLYNYYTHYTTTTQYNYYAQRDALRQWTVEVNIAS